MKTRTLVIGAIGILTAGLAFYLFNKEKFMKAGEPHSGDKSHAEGEAKMRHILHKAKEVSLASQS